MADRRSPSPSRYAVVPPESSPFLSRAASPSYSEEGHTAHKQHSLYSLTPRRRPLLCFGFALLFIILLGLNFAAYQSSGISLYEFAANYGVNSTEHASVLASGKPRIERLKALHGAPTTRFRENLRGDLKYVHSWISAGWTNDLMTYANLIYLGILSDRIPIVHYFNWDVPGTPTDVPPMPFSSVFDLDRLSDEIGMPVLEWDEVKAANSTEVEELGCWNVWEAVQYRDHFPRVPFGGTWEKQHLDISWTTVPSSVKILPGNQNDQWARIWDLAALTFSFGRARNMSPPKESPHHHHTAPPDEHMACFDYLYYTSATVSDEYWYMLSPVWREVGRHIHWQPTLQALGNEYMRRMFDLAEGATIPPFISIHARRGDFFTYCDIAGLAHDVCYPSMTQYAEAVDRLRAAIEVKLGVSPTHVVMLSDETDPAWWAEIRQQGWYVPDHEGAGTVEKYGWWHPVLLDAVIQSSGVGLLGTPDSTFSLVAGRRVMDWNGGVYHEMPWAGRESPVGVPVP